MSQIFKDVDYDKHFVIGTPLVAWKCERKEHLAWLKNYEEIVNSFPNAKFFSTFEIDYRGIEPFKDVIEVLEKIKGNYWTYSINDFEANVTYRNRWIRIETGRNLIREFAQRKRIVGGNHWGENTYKDNIGVSNYDAVIYVDSDMYITKNIIEKMFEINHPLVSVNVPAYGLKGRVINESPRIEEHWNTAGILLVNSPAFYDLPWSHNAYRNYSDDPTFQLHAQRLIQFESEESYGMTWVRKDISATHMGQLVPVESRNIPKRVV
jgi:hypothetical protein